MTSRIADLIERALGSRPRALTPLSGGCVALVMRADMPDGSRLVVKHDPSPASPLETEGFMLRSLKERTALPAPGVVHCASNLLVMEFVEGSTGASFDAEEHAAESLAELHDVTTDRFGFERDTVIGGLPQPNPPASSWIIFFREHRLLFMAVRAAKAGRLPRELLGRVERFANELDRLLIEPDEPALIHGDVWSGNVLSRHGRVTAFLDPAIYFADAEIELAFITLFSTFGQRFFDAYAERRPIRDGFFESRREIYNLYPLLVHVCLFGGGYVGSVDRTLRRFGF